MLYTHFPGPGHGVTYGKIRDLPWGSHGVLSTTSLMTKKEHRRYCQKVAKALPCDWAINPQLERHVVRAAASSAEFEKRPAVIDIAVYRSHEATSPMVILRTPKVQDMTIRDAIYAVQNEADRQHALPPWER